MIKFAGYNESELQNVFKEHSDKMDWKKSFSAIIPTKKEADKLEKAIIFFHGCKPETEMIRVPIRHKQGLVYFGMNAYEVKSKGYLCEK